MSKHTPGPWEVRIPFSTAARHPAYIVGGDLILAAIAIPGDAYQDLQAAHANARLMAVAPRLLEALERLIASDDAHATIHAPDGDDVARMLEYAAAFDSARAAIRAARGE